MTNKNENKKKEQNIQFSKLLIEYINEINQTADKKIREAIQSEMNTRDISPEKYAAVMESLSFINIEENTKQTPE